MFNIYLLFVASLGTCTGMKNPDAWFSQETRLKNDLLKDYDSTVPPLVKETDNVSVSLGVSLVSLDNLDEKSEILSTHIFFRVSWRDVRLEWNKDDYNGLTTVAVPHNRIWRPDIVPYNSIAADNTHSLEYMAMVSMDGSVWFISKMELHTMCTVDLTYFPFDIQECEMKFGSWVYHGTVVVIQSASISLPNSTKWQIWDAGSKVSASKFDCCPETFYDFTARIGLQRITATTLNLYMGPAVCFGLLIAVMFLLPASSSHKLVLGTGLLISQVLMLEMLVEILPTNHFTVPGLGMYFLANIILLSLSLAHSAVVIRLWAQSKRRGNGVPAVIDKLFNGYLGRILCVKLENYMETSETKMSFAADIESIDGSHVTDGEFMMKDYTHSMVRAKWRQLSVILDRLFCVIFMVVWAIITASLLHFRVSMHKTNQ